MSLQPCERETILLMADDSDLATVETWQRPVITKLKKNSAAKLLAEYASDGTAGARFILPANLISFRRPRTGQKKELSKAQVKAMQEGRKRGRK